MLIDPGVSSSTERRATEVSRRVRTAAVRALWQEVVTYPKPGLVSLVDSGSHDDMDASTFLRSTFSLRRYFETITVAGMAGAPFDDLRHLGVEAERRMVRATAGVNTHRGAIFNLGLIAAAAGRRYALAMPDDKRSLGAIVRDCWGAALASHRRDPTSHGARVEASFSIGGALAEAVAGFPTVFDLALPCYRATLARGGSANQARVQTFFTLMSTVADTNLLHRGGTAGLAHARDLAARFLAEGGVHDRGWIERARAIHRSCCDMRLSPGGSADLLAVCIFVQSLES